ncbi:sensor histidine kinase [Kineococcus esterisolvens]|uniref:sensor histidine kinase n=1 Tax=Kineococcus sp. SYSU DK015 TaxID=3383136 RepID=UPI003D7EE36B
MQKQNVFDRLVAWPRVHVLLLDSLGALALTFVCVATASATGGGAVLVSVLMCLPLAARRVRPELSGGLVAAGGLLQPVLAADPQVANVTVLVALYSLAAYAAPWASRGGLLLGLFGALVAPARYVLPSVDLLNALAAALFIAVLVVATWLLGRLRRASRRNEQALMERARLLENERENESRLAATAERQRIAREMHDVVAHSLSVIIAQADGGRYAAAANPAAAAEVLGTISSTGRQALADMRNLLGVLRQGPGDERTPQPDAAQVADLVEQVRASGLDVALDVTGEPREVPPAVGLAAYRIVQESLTNVLKHAGPAARARVEVRWDPDALRLGVDDDGRGAAALVTPSPGGQGLAGMAERARLHGGAVVTGPRPGGGFSVRATLPYASPR